MTDQLGFNDKLASSNISKLLKSKKMRLPFRKLKDKRLMILPKAK